MERGRAELGRVWAGVAGGLTGLLTVWGGSARLTNMRYGGRVEYAQERKIRERNTRLYRLAHWPIWIWVFFLAPGPLTFTLVPAGEGRVP